MVAVHDGGVQVVRPPQHRGGLPDVALGQTGPDPAGRPAPSLRRRHVRQRHHVEAVPLAQLAQRLQVAGVLVPEADVDADDHRGGAERLDHGPGHPLLRALPRQVEVEALHQQGVQTGLPQQLDPLVRAGDERWSDIRPQHVQRVRLEGYRHGTRPAVPGDVDDLAQHRGVTPVHPVEVADGDDGRPGLGGHLDELSPHVHADRVPGAGPGTWRQVVSAALGVPRAYPRSAATVVP